MVVVGCDSRICSLPWLWVSNVLIDRVVECIERVVQCVAKVSRPCVVCTMAIQGLKLVEGKEAEVEAEVEAEARSTKTQPPLRNLVLFHSNVKHGVLRLESR